MHYLSTVEICEDHLARFSKAIWTILMHFLDIYSESDVAEEFHMKMKTEKSSTWDDGDDGRMIENPDLAKSISFSFQIVFIF